MQTPNNRRFGELVRAQFDIDAAGASAAMRVCRLYAERKGITSQLSWAALVAICASTVSAKARQDMDHRIVAAKRVALRQIKEAERSLTAQAGSASGGTPGAAE